jgi:FMN phosphatase YigB (HAD superfamily)
LKLEPKEVLFIDDSIQHIESAKEVGIQTHHFTKEVKLTEYFEMAEER